MVNAADEVAVRFFLEEKIRFYDIYRAVEYIFSKTKKDKVSNLKGVYFWDRWARAKTEEFLDNLCG